MFDEVNAPEKNSSNLSFKLKQAELIVQQLSSEPCVAAAQFLVEQLQKSSLESQVKEVNWLLSLVFFITVSFKHPLTFFVTFWLGRQSDHLRQFMQIFQIH